MSSGKRDSVVKTYSFFIIKDKNSYNKNWIKVIETLLDSSVNLVQYFEFLYLSIILYRVWHYMSCHQGLHTNTELEILDIYTEMYHIFTYNDIYRFILTQILVTHRNLSVSLSVCSTILLILSVTLLHRCLKVPYHCQWSSICFVLYHRGSPTSPLP